MRFKIVMTILAVIAIVMYGYLVHLHDVRMDEFIQSDVILELDEIFRED